MGKRWTIAEDATNSNALRLATSMQTRIDQQDVQCQHKELGSFGGKQCKFVRGHDEPCSFDLETQIKARSEDNSRLRAELVDACTKLVERGREMEAVQEVLELHLEADQAKQLVAADALRAYLMKQMGVDFEQAADIAMQAVEIVRPMLREEFKSTYAKNLVAERDQLRQKLDSIDRDKKLLDLLQRQRVATGRESIPLSEVSRLDGDGRKHSDHAHVKLYGDDERPPVNLPSKKHSLNPSRDKPKLPPPGGWYETGLGRPRG